MKFLNNFCKLLRPHIKSRCHVQAVQRVGANELACKLKQTNETVKRALKIFKSDELILCFNGGKDSTVLLDIIMKLQLKPQLGIMHVKSYDAFEEVQQFIDDCARRYHIKIKRYHGSLQLAVEDALTDYPKVRAVLLGNRRSDPCCALLKDMVPTDKGWPQLMRILPLLDWNYNDVWNYLLVNKVPYCSLYDKGYTSLGDKSSTHVNPALLMYDEAKKELVYRPAYELQDISKERSNREEIHRQKKQQPN